jgi:heat shock protein HslJ
MLKEGTFPIIVTLALAVVMIGAGAMTGCSSDDDIPAELLTIWQLEGFILGDGTMTPVDDPAKYTVEFQDSGNAHVVSDCNTCNGPFFVDGSDLSFGALACTRVACPPGSFDTRFQAALGTVSGWEIDGPLFLTHDGGQLQLRPQPTLF